MLTNGGLATIVDLCREYDGSVPRPDLNANDMKAKLEGKSMDQMTQSMNRQINQLTDMMADPFQTLVAVMMNPHGWVRVCAARSWTWVASKQSWNMQCAIISCLDSCS